MTIDTATRYWVVGDSSPDDLRVFAQTHEAEVAKCDAWLEQHGDNPFAIRRRDYNRNQVQYYRDLADALERETSATLFPEQLPEDHSDVDN